MTTPSPRPPGRDTPDVAHDLANVAMQLDALTTRFEHGAPVEPTELRSAVDRLYALVNELTEPGS